MLKSTKTELDLLTDVDQVLFVESNIRGGMSYISTRYAKAGKNTAADGKDFFMELLYIDGNSYVILLVNILGYS